MCFILGAMFGMLGTSFLCDRWGYKKTLLTATTLALTLLSAFLILPFYSTPTTIILLAFLGTTLYLMNPIITAWGNHLVPESPSTVSALLMGLAWCFSNLAAVIGGYLASIFPYLIAMGFISILLFVSLGFALLIPNTQFQTTENETLTS